MLEETTAVIMAGWRVGGGDIGEKVKNDMSRSRGVERRWHGEGNEGYEKQMCQQLWGSGSKQK